MGWRCYGRPYGAGPWTSHGKWLHVAGNMGHSHLPRSAGPSPVQVLSQLHLPHLLTELLFRSQPILVRAMCCPVVVVLDVVWHHHLPIHLLHGLFLLLLAAEEILADSTGHSDVVTSRDGGCHRTRGFEC